MGDLTPVLGILCGMKAEVRALGAWVDDPRVRVGISGARPDLAEAEARRLVAEGCRALLSWGVAGGLDPALAQGDLVTAEAVLHADGTALRATAVPEVPIHRCLGAERMIASPAQKAELHTRLGAGFVDLESLRAADVAVTTGIPLFVLRAIADPAARALPPIVAGILGSDGTPRLGAILAGIARQPWQIAALWGLRREFAAGLQALARAKDTVLPAILEAISPSSARA